MAGGGPFVEFTVESAVVEPLDVDEGGELELLDVPPGSLRPDEFGLVEPDRRFGHRVVIAIADGADGGQRADLVKTISVLNTCVLTGVNRSLQHSVVERRVVAR